MENKSFMMGILVVVIGVGGFFGGMKYQQTGKVSESDAQSFGIHPGADSQRGMGGAWRQEGSGMVAGEIISQDETSLTVKQADDSTKIILLSEDTVIQKAAEGGVEDLKTGERVMIFGQENPDGSISAVSIQLNPRLGEGPGRTHDSN